MTIKHPDTISGTHIRLRPADPSDRYRVFQALVRWSMVDILRGPPALKDRPLIGFEDLCDVYRTSYFDDSIPEGGRCFIIEVEDQAVGQINYYLIDRARSRTELNIWMFREQHCGRGYGSEALNLMCGYLQKRFDLNGFYIKPSADNPRAIRCYEKAGFSRFDLTAEEALREYGIKDHADTICMKRKIEGHAG